MEKNINQTVNVIVNTDNFTDEELIQELISRIGGVGLGRLIEKACYYDAFTVCRTLEIAIKNRAKD